MIFERSLDIKDWSNYAENSALMKITIILKYTKKRTIILDCKNILQFLWCFWSNKCSLASFRNITILQPQTCEQWCVFFSELWDYFWAFWSLIHYIWVSFKFMFLQEGEDAVQFANRVKAAIAIKGGLADLLWWVPVLKSVKHTRD